MFYFLDEPIEPFYNNPTVNTGNTQIIVISIAIAVVVIVAIITTILIKKGKKNV